MQSFTIWCNAISIGPDIHFLSNRIFLLLFSYLCLNTFGVEGERKIETYENEMLDISFCLHVQCASFVGTHIRTHTDMNACLYV